MTIEEAKEKKLWIELKMSEMVTQFAIESQLQVTGIIVYQVQRNDHKTEYAVRFECKML